jgi:hypothetical protein
MGNEAAEATGPATGDALAPGAALAADGGLALGDGLASITVEGSSADGAGDGLGLCAAAPIESTRTRHTATGLAKRRITRDPPGIG